MVCMDPIKKPVLLVTLGFLIVTSLLMWVASDQVWKRMLGTLTDEMAQDLNLYMYHLDAAIQLNQQVAAVISRSSEVLALLANPQDPSVQNTANRFLENISTEVHTQDLYVFNTQGALVAASNWQKTTSFLGQNYYAFRSYFQEAIEGRSNYHTHIVVLGITSGDPGLYMAEPVRVNGQIRGVAVLKAAFDRYRLLSNNLNQVFATTDQNGVVFLSSRNEWLYTTVRPLSDFQHRLIQKSHQYPRQLPKPFPAVALSAVDGVTRQVRLPDVPIKNSLPFVEATHLSQSTLYLQQGWEIRIFSSLAPACLAVWITWAVGLLSSLLVYAGILFVLQRHRYIDELRDAALHDPLTGLYNRGYLGDAFGIQVSYISRNQKNFLVGAMLDIDHFKSINDSYGHQEGDRVLKAVGHIIQYGIRKSDTAIRYGGEEFAILLVMEEGKNALACIERIRANIQAFKFKPPLDTVRITLSAGVAHYRDKEQLDDLLARADILLYQAKNQGRNRICCDRSPLPALDADWAAQAAL